jgi:hypothetical protein
MIRTPQTVIRRSPGQEIRGRWVEGQELPPETILASVQPANAGDYDTLEATNSGRRIERVVRVYTDALLPVAGADDTNGAILVWEGERYLFIAISPWRTTVLKHYRYLASKELP